jgi:hypothetical protein
MIPFRHFGGVNKFLLQHRKQKLESIDFAQANRAISLSRTQGFRSGSAVGKTTARRKKKTRKKKKKSLNGILNE